MIFESWILSVTVVLVTVFQNKCLVVPDVLPVNNNGLVIYNY